MKLNLFDCEREGLLPLTFTRPVAQIRVGAGTIADHWQRLWPDCTVGYETEPYLSEKFPPLSDAQLRIAGNLLPTPPLVEAIQALTPGNWIADADGQLIAAMGTAADGTAPQATVGELRRICRPYDVFGLSRRQITDDFASLTRGRRSAPLPESCTLIGPADGLFIEEGADVEGCFINTRQGPVYIAADAEVQELTALRGPVWIDRKSRVRAGARLLPGTNVGPRCKVGGEVSNAVFFGNANKQHDGYLGDAVIGEWCNLGAGCTSSNLKNDYSPIRLWNYATRRFDRTGLQFCGLIMGDHSKAGINTMFNTATVVGVGCNIHGAGFPRNFIASFSDGGAQGFTDVVMSKFFATARIVTSRRGVEFTAADEAILNHIHDITAENHV
jgi:UDP-N-acetylglucosamine diphosphorylase/glucosamine-1-phosphate N-acetyltransferase